MKLYGIKSNKNKQKLLYTLQFVDNLDTCITNWVIEYLLIIYFQASSKKYKISIILYYLKEFSNWNIGKTFNFFRNACYLTFYISKGIVWQWTDDQVESIAINKTKSSDKERYKKVWPKKVIIMHMEVDIEYCFRTFSQCIFK